MLNSKFNSVKANCAYTVKLAKEAVDELQTQKQKIWDMANDLFQVLQIAERSLKKYNQAEGEVLALIETTLVRYRKKGNHENLEQE